MIEKTVYICEICNATYATKELAQQCEKSGFPKYHDKFVGKWIITPLQIFSNFEEENKSFLNTKIEWFPVRIESNDILSPVVAFTGIKMYHSLRFSSRSFYNHNIVKNFLDFAIIVDEKYREELNKFLVEAERNRTYYPEENNQLLVSKVKKYMEEIAK